MKEVVLAEGEFTINYAIRYFENLQVSFKERPNELVYLSPSSLAGIILKGRIVRKNARIWLEVGEKPKPKSSKITLWDEKYE
jgi:hypothetical protein